MQQSLWPGRTSWNVNIHWEHLVDASNRRVVLAEDAATDSASAHRDDYFGFRHRPIRFQKREFHVAGDRPSHQEHVGMTRRGDELNSEAFDVMDRIIHGDNLQLASIAGSCVHFPDGEVPSQTFLDWFVAFLPKVLDCPFA